MKSETHDISSIFHSDMQRKSVRFVYRLFQYSEVPKSFRRVFSALLRMVRLPLLKPSCSLSTCFWNSALSDAFKSQILQKRSSFTCCCEICFTISVRDPKCSPHLLQSKLFTGIIDLLFTVTFLLAVL